MVRVDVVDIPMPRIAIYIRNDCILYYFNSNKFDLQCAGARPNDDHIQSMGCNRSTQQQRQQQHTEGNLEDNNKKLKEKNKLSRRRRERTIFPHTYPQFSNLAFRWRSSMMHAYATMILSARYEICVCIKWWCSWPCPASACVLFFFLGIRFDTFDICIVILIRLAIWKYSPLACFSALYRSQPKMQM